jgi:predicted amidohydrolase
MKVVLTQLELSSEPTDHFQGVRAALDRARVALGPADILVLPERFDFRSAELYRASARRLARHLGCHVVAGSCHVPQGERIVNAGIVVDPDGRILADYEKLRPYGDELMRVSPGFRLGQFQIAGRRIVVLICADFWFSDVFERIGALPDLVLVPALSVTRKPASAYAQALWWHLCVCRSYEFGAYVGISDWAEGSDLRVGRPAGVAGFADPTVVQPERLFERVGGTGVLVVEPDFERLRQFRKDRIERGFFWRPLPEER